MKKKLVLLGLIVCLGFAHPGYIWAEVNQQSSEDKNEFTQKQAQMVESEDTSASFASNQSESNLPTCDISVVDPTIVVGAKVTINLSIHVAEGQVVPAGTTITLNVGDSITSLNASDITVPSNIDASYNSKDKTIIIKVKNEVAQQGDIGVQLRLTAANKGTYSYSAVSSLWKSITVRNAPVVINEKPIVTSDWIKAGYDTKTEKELSNLGLFSATRLNVSGSSGNFLSNYTNDGNMGKFSLEINLGRFNVIQNYSLNASFAADPTHIFDNENNPEYSFLNYSGDGAITDGKQRMGEGIGIILNAPDSTTIDIKHAQILDTNGKNILAGDTTIPSDNPEFVIISNPKNPKQIGIVNVTSISTAYDSPYYAIIPIRLNGDGSTTTNITMYAGLVDAFHENSQVSSSSTLGYKITRVPNTTQFIPRVIVDKDTEEVSYGEDKDNLLSQHKGLTALDVEDGDISHEIYVADDGGLDTHKPGSYVVTYEVADSDGNKVSKKVTYVVSHNEKAQVIVKYVDDKGNEIHASQTITGSYGESYNVNEYAVDIPKYTLDKENLPNNTNGTYADAPIIVTYHYKVQKPANITLHFEDSDGAKLLDDQIVSGDGSIVGDSYDFTNKHTEFDKSLLGKYIFSKVKGPVTGSWSSNSQDITFIYDGQLVFADIPTIVGFGKHELSDQTQVIGVQSKDHNLLIEDNRSLANKPSWQLSANLVTDFKGEKTNDILKDVLYYNNTPLPLNQAVAIASQNTTKHEDINLSEDWSSTTGLVMKVPVGEAMADHYSGTIQWTLIDNVANN